MKIISKFHDYYDIALSQGHDDHIVYVRTTKEVNRQEVVYKHRWRNKVDYDFKFIGFCGKIIPLVEVDITDREKENKYLRYYCYTTEDLIKCLESHNQPIEFERKSWRRGSLGLTNLGKSKRFLEMSQFSRLDIFQEYTVPIFIAKCKDKRRSDNYYEVSDEIILNPKLSDYDFYRLVDPYTAYQEIEMFFGGVLGSMEADLTEVSDENRYAGHGYDKESFRQPKGRKKPRNKGK